MPAIISAKLCLAWRRSQQIFNQEGFFLIVFKPDNTLPVAPSQFLYVYNWTLHDNTSYRNPDKDSY